MHFDIPAGPQWFLGRDFIIDLVSVVVLLLIGFFSWKYYSLNKSNKKHLLIFTSLVLLGLSFIFKIATYFILYSTHFQVQVYQLFGRMVYYVTPTSSLFAVSFIIYAALTLLGFFIFFTVYEKLSLKSVILIMYLMVAVVLFSEDAYIFMHLTAFLLTLMIALSLWKSYRINGMKTTKCLALSFGIISLSLILFILAHNYSSMYVVGELVQLAGYVVLLVTFISVLKHGKKKGKTTNN
jgi:hypothetical protein